MQMVHRKPKNNDSLLLASLLVLVLAPGGSVHAQTRPSGSSTAARQLAEPQTVFRVPAAPEIAITFDDLPAHSALSPGETRLEVATKIIAALRDAHLPAIYGFMNGLPVEQQPADAEVLQAWRAAGFPLGDRTWSHMNLNQHSLAEFEADSSRNEPLLREWMKGEDWHWFRFPFLAEGDTPEKKSAIRSFLLHHGYKVAAVTMSFGDYQWNEPYARCRAKGDSTAVASLESSYLEAADASIRYDRNLSQTLYGRDIPYVLLMHVGAFDAEMLPRLLALYRSRSFQFVTLGVAESDPFYVIDTDLSLPPGANSLERVMAERQLALPAHPVPTVQLDSLCR